MLCMGALTAFSALSFAQTDVTNKVLNPDAEKGMLGWDVTFIDGGQIWNKQTSRPSIGIRLNRVNLMSELT